MKQPIEVIDFWNKKAPSGYAHLNPEREFIESANSDFKRTIDEFFLENVSIEGKTLIDYGAGRGHLGKYLLAHGLEKYIDIDISERSLDVARENLKGTNSEFYITPISFSSLSANVFVSLACIQHFPSIEYLNDFLNNLNESGIRDLWLQIKWSDKTQAYDSYKKKKKYGIACLTNTDYMKRFLSKYTLKKDRLGKVKEFPYHYSLWRLS